VVDIGSQKDNDNQNQKSRISFWHRLCISVIKLKLSLGLGAASPTSIRPWRQALCKLNADKTAAVVRSCVQLPSQSSTVHVNQCVVKPATDVRDLGVWLDAKLSMRSHVSRAAQTCFYHLRRIRVVHRHLGRDVTARLVTARVLSRLDYCNAVLAGLPASTLAPFRRVLHAAACTAV